MCSREGKDEEIVEFNNNQRGRGEFYIACEGVKRVWELPRLVEKLINWIEYVFLVVQHAPMYYYVYVLSDCDVHVSHKNNIAVLTQWIILWNVSHTRYVQSVSRIRENRFCATTLPNPTHLLPVYIIEYQGFPFPSLSFPSLIYAAAGVDGPSQAFVHYKL